MKFFLQASVVLAVIMIAIWFLFPQFRLAVLAFWAIPFLPPPP